MSDAQCPELVLRGSRVVLRDWKAEDLPVLEHWFQPGSEWRHLDGPYYPETSACDVSERLEPYRRAVDAAELPTPRVVMAVASVVDDSLIGRVSRYWQSEETLWLSLGIDLFDPQRWARGMGREALGLWGQYILDGMPGLVRLDLRTWSGNVRMMRLAEGLGFTLEARFRDARVVRGEHHDALGYGMLRAEWNQRYPDGFAAHLARAEGSVSPRGTAAD